MRARAKQFLRRLDALAQCHGGPQIRRPMATATAPTPRTIRGLPEITLRRIVDSDLERGHKKYPYYPSPLADLHFRIWHDRPGPCRASSTLRLIRGIFGPLFTGFDYPYYVRFTDALEIFCLATEHSPGMFPQWHMRHPGLFVSALPEWLARADEGLVAPGGVLTATAELCGCGPRGDR